MRSRPEIRLPLVVLATMVLAGCGTAPGPLAAAEPSPRATSAYEGVRLAARLPTADDIPLGSWDLVRRSADGVVSSPLSGEVECIDRLDLLLAEDVARLTARVEFEGGSFETDGHPRPEFLDYEAYSDVDAALFDEIDRMIDDCDGVRSEFDDDHRDFSVHMSRTEPPLPEGAIGFQVVRGDFDSAVWTRTVLFRASDDTLLVVSSLSSRESYPTLFAIVRRAILGYQESMHLE